MEKNTIFVDSVSSVENGGVVVAGKLKWMICLIAIFNHIQDLCHKVPIPLYDILELNEEAMTVHVEPMVTVGDITRYLIPKGWTFVPCTFASSYVHF